MRVPPPPPPPTTSDAAYIAGAGDGWGRMPAPSPWPTAAGQQKLPKRYASTNNMTDVSESPASHQIPHARLKRTMSTEISPSLIQSAIDQQPARQQNNPVIRRLSSVIRMQRESDSSIEPNLLALRGDLPTLREHVLRNPGLRTAVFTHYLSSGPLLSTDEENDHLYHPPPIFPRSLRAALAVESVADMTRDQRWLIDHGFGKSTLLHYACAGDQVAVVKYLIDEQNVDAMVLNDAKKLPEFYATSDAVRQAIHGKEPKTLVKKNSMLINLLDPNQTEVPAVQGTDRGLIRTHRAAPPPPQSPLRQPQASASASASAPVPALASAAPALPLTPPPAPAPSAASVRSQRAAAAPAAPAPRPSICTDSVASVKATEAPFKPLARRLSRVMSSRRLSARFSIDSQTSDSAPASAPAMPAMPVVVEAVTTADGSTYSNPLRNRPPPPPPAPAPVATAKPAAPAPPPPPPPIDRTGLNMGKLAMFFQQVSSEEPDPARPVSTRFRRLFPVPSQAQMADEPITVALPVPEYRPTLAIRRLSVKGNFLESIAFENDGQGGVVATEALEEEIAPAVTARPITPPPPPKVNPKVEAQTHRQPFNQLKAGSLLSTSQPRSAPGTLSEASEKDMHDVAFQLEECMHKASTALTLAALSPSQLEKLPLFAQDHMRPLRDIANEMLHAHSEARLSEDLVQRLLSNPQGALASQPSVASTQSAPAYVPKDLRKKPKAVDPTTLPPRVMLWRRAGEQLNQGVFDSDDPAVMRRRQQAYDRGQELLRKEFRSYAEKDNWEALDRWQEKTAQKMEDALLQRLRAVKRVKQESSRASAKIMARRPGSAGFSRSEMDSIVRWQAQQERAAEEEALLRQQVRRISCLMVGIEGSSLGYYDIDEELRKLRAWLLESQVLPMDALDRGPLGNLPLPSEAPARPSPPHHKQQTPHGEWDRRDDESLRLQDLQDDSDDSGDAVDDVARRLSRLIELG